MALKEKEVIDLDLSVTRKKAFRFDRDDSRIVELNISDMNILSRLTDTYPKLNQWLIETQELSASISDEEDGIVAAEKLGNKLKEIDKSMREAIDYIFNAPVSQAAAPDGSMYDIFEGSFRYEYILELLLKHYENNMATEFNKMKKHVEKYTKGK